VSAFDQARDVEARSLVVLEPFLVERHGRYVLTGKGRLARYLQERVGDLLFNDRAGNVWSVELKAEQKSTGNLFLETWSNRNFDDPVSHAEHGCTVGWLLKATADLLLYHFLDCDRLYAFNLLALKRWAFTAESVRKAEDGGKLPGRVYDFVELVQQKYRQPNRTAGRIVPIRVLERECRPPPKLLHPRQLLLDLGKG
jgi:hypothetical protein